MTEAARVPPTPRWTSGDLVGVGNDLAALPKDMTTVEEVARIVLNGAIRDGLVVDARVSEGASPTLRELGGSRLPAPPDPRLDEIAARLNAATPGPWELVPRFGNFKILVGRRDTADSIGWFDSEAEAIAVRDALNRVAGGVSGGAPATP